MRILIGDLDYTLDHFIKFRINSTHLQCKNS